MKDSEIKEMLDYFRNYITEKYETYTVVDCHTQYIKTLLDYITKLEEEKKIPEKLKSLNNVGNSSDIGEFEDKQQLNNHLIKDKLNEIIDYLDYLKSKGDK